jgi:16S rRNA C967 or C1407 C5-methylase (RsmB/RsmF family)/NOL1/NOP2/fmu family ribosome biogenesis protein
MKLPIQLLESIGTTPGFDRLAFEQVHASDEQVTSIRLNPAKARSISQVHSISETSPVPWSAYGYYLAERPSFTFDPFFHAGCYYVQEASSMFLEHALRSHADLTAPLNVLDLSAAPGGKSTHLQSLISANSLLVSNEVIRSRAATLRDNIIKWGSPNVIVTNNDPKDFARLEGFFDVIVVDAPCSGSGLFRRDPDAISEWSLRNVDLCSQRQQRILADVWPALKGGGLLIYSTCSYSREEDEDIMDWISHDLAASNLALNVPDEWGVVGSVSAKGNRGYRFWPYSVRGEGFFLSCFQKPGDANASVEQKRRMAKLTKSELNIVAQWIDTEGKEFVKHENVIYAWPLELNHQMNTVLSNTRVIYSGVRIGELMREKLVPDHALAMSTAMLNPSDRLDLDYEDAIRYLQRKDIVTSGGNKGWKLACYDNFPLGWVNVLANRINNYYPKELRILKETN